MLPRLKRAGNEHRSSVHSPGCLRQQRTEEARCFGMARLRSIVRDTPYEVHTMYGGKKYSVEMLESQALESHPI